MRGAEIRSRAGARLKEFCLVKVGYFAGARPRVIFGCEGGGGMIK